jgi:hypothetical protein
MCLAKGSTLIISTTPGFGSAIKKWKLFYVPSFSGRYQKSGTGTNQINSEAKKNDNKNKSLRK